MVLAIAKKIDSIINIMKKKRIDFPYAIIINIPKILTKKINQCSQTTAFIEDRIFFVSSILRNNLSMLKKVMCQKIAKTNNEMIVIKVKSKKLISPIG